MRISSGMIYDAGVSAINKQASDLLHMQQQLATGKRVLTPADDPVASANALDVTQSVGMTKQYTTAQDNADSALGFTESQLQSATDLLTQVRTLAVQAGNATLTNTDRQSIATQLRSSFDQLMGIANSKDASGQYVFAGYMGNTTPFSGSVESGVSYFGDDGQRLLQVSPSQQIAVSDSGNSVFNRVPTGDGTFSVTYTPTNSGTAVVSSQSMVNPANWSNVSNSGNLEIQFWTDPATNNTYYDLTDVSVNPPVSLFTGTSSTAGGVGNTYTHAYGPGNPINFSGLAAPYTDLGASVTISGTPASGDSFRVQSSTSQSMFDTLRNLVSALERPVSSTSGSGMTMLTNDIAVSINNLDQASQNILTVRAKIGARLTEMDALRSVNESVSLQYQQVLSNLQDVDYTKTISDLTRTQTQLQAAQQSFVKVANLSLFNYITT